MRLFIPRPRMGLSLEPALRGARIATPVLILLMGAQVRFSVAAEVRLTLPAALRMAQEHSKAVKSARHDSSSAVFRRAESRAGYFPTLSLGATAFYKNELPTINVPPAGIEIGSHGNYQADVTLSMPLYTGGRVSNLARIGSRNIETQHFNLEVERLENACLTRRAYLSLLTAQLIVQAAEASLRRVAIIEQDVRNLFENGMADSLDLLDAGLAVREAMRLRDEKETARDNASSALARLIGTDPQDVLTPVDQVPPPPDEPDRSLAAAGIARPEVMMLDSRIRAAELQVRLARSQYAPILNGFGSYSAGKPNQDLFNKEWNDYFSAGVRLTWEFNLGGKVDGGVNAAIHAAESAKMMKKELEESLALAAAVAARGVRHAHEAHRIAREEYEIAKHKFRLAKEKQKAGSLSVNRLLELEAELAAVELRYLASKSGYYIAETELLYATGSERIYGGL
ncbi:MAG: TolC family protein [Chitinivibrionia bacterium]|nr:TolC family protein [Chitinivibrionia bacterium]